MFTPLQYDDVNWLDLFHFFTVSHGDWWMWRRFEMEGPWGFAVLMNSTESCADMNLTTQRRMRTMVAICCVEGMYTMPTVTGRSAYVLMEVSTRHVFLYQLVRQLTTGVFVTQYSTTLAINLELRRPRGLHGNNWQVTRKASTIIVNYTSSHHQNVCLKNTFHGYI